MSFIQGTINSEEGNGVWLIKENIAIEIVLMKNNLGFILSSVFFRSMWLSHRAMLIIVGLTPQVIQQTDFQAKCGHPHNESCEQCCLLKEVLTTLESECSYALCTDKDKEDILHTMKQAKNNNMTWNAHQLRSVHQDQAKTSVLSKIKSKSDVFLVQDWAMKFMPRKFREPQSDWFAKRGLPWHITVAIRKSEESEHFESQTLILCASFRTVLKTVPLWYL